MAQTFLVDPIREVSAPACYYRRLFETSCALSSSATVDAFSLINMDGQTARHAAAAQVASRKACAVTSRIPRDRPIPAPPQGADKQGHSPVTPIRGFPTIGDQDIARPLWRQRFRGRATPDRRHVARYGVPVRGAGASAIGAPATVP
ncbi:MAG: hypothetical protein NVSMB65_08090 [Chloroflexota bacterium]